MKNRKLGIKSETVVEIGSIELAEVDGGAATQVCTDKIPTYDGCFTHTTTLDCLTRRLCQ